MQELKTKLEDLGVFLNDNNLTMSFKQLADLLNTNGYRTQQGFEYEGTRGTAKIIGDIYKELVSNGKIEKSEKFRLAFVGKNGELAY